MCRCGLFSLSLIDWIVGEEPAGCPGLLHLQQTHFGDLVRQPPTLLETIDGVCDQDLAENLLKGNDDNYLVEIGVQRTETSSIERMGMSGCLKRWPVLSRTGCDFSLNIS